MATRTQLQLERTLRLVAIAVALTLGGCAGGDDGDAPAGTTSFTSLAPGGGGGANKSAGEAGAGGTGAPSNDSGGQDAAKVEQGDVARLFGNTLYVLNQWRGLQVVDLKDPKAPKLVQRVAMTGQPREMYVDGSTAIVALSHVAKVDDKAGAPAPSASSQLRVVSLGDKPAVVATVDVPGTIAATKKVGDKLVVVAPQVVWNPWWFGCYGPWGCVATAGGTKGAETDTATGSSGGASTGSATTGDAPVSSGGSVAYPGGYGGGWAADSTLVLVYDLKGNSLAKVGEVTIDGGVLEVSIEAGEALIASQQWKWNDKDQTSSVTERLTQIVLASDGKPSLGAALVATGKADSGVAAMVKMHRVGKGHVVVLRQAYKSGGIDQVVTQYGVDGGKWAKGGEKVVTGNYYGMQVAFDGASAVLAHGKGGAGGKDDDGKGDDGDDKGTEPAPTPGSGGGSGGSGGSGSSGGAEPDPGSSPGGIGGIGELKLVALDLANVATVVDAGSAVLNASGDLWSTSIAALGGGTWLLGFRSGDGQTGVLDTVRFEAGKAVFGGKLELAGAYGYGVEQLSAALLLVPTYASKGDGGEVEGGLQLVSVSKEGKLSKRGLFASSFYDWSKLGNLLADAQLLRIANAGLEVVDVKDLDAPKVIGKLELATSVQDLVVVGDRVVALVHNWTSNSAALRVLPKGSDNDLDASAQVAVDAAWGQLRVHGSMVYVIADQGVQVVDIADAAKPTLRGKLSWAQTGQVNEAGHSRYWNSWNLPQKGSVLYLVGTDMKLEKKTGTACSGGGGGSSVPPSSGGGSEPDSSGGSSGSSGSGGSSGTPAPGGTDTPDGGDSKPEDGKPEDGKDIEDVCWDNPTYTTLVAALDLTNPDKPVLGKVVELPGVAWTSEATVAGQHLVLTHYESKKAKDGSWSGSYWLDRFALTDPVAPKFVDKINIPGWLVGLSADGSSLVTLDWQYQKGSKPEDYKVENLLHALTISKGKAVLKKTLALPSQVGAIVRDGDTIFAATMAYWWMWPADAGAASATLPKSELWVFDAKDPAKLAQTATLDAGAGVGSLEVAGGHLFAGTATGLGVAVWDVATPTQPTYEGFVPTQGGAWRVSVVGGTAYLPAGWYGVASAKLD